MKLRYFIPAVMAALAVTFTSCSDDNDPTYLSQVQVSQSYVSLNTAGGSTTIDVKATGNWEFSNVPEWLTISPATGSGNATVTFSAEEGVGRTAEVLLLCDGQTQRINVIQGIAEVAVATCAEVIAGPDSKTYRVTGVCVSNPDNQYGNWYLEDETGRIYIYGTNDKKGSKGAYPVSGANGWGFAAGDVLTIEGPKTTYNGTVELVDVTVISITKSLVKIEEGETSAFDANGGDFMVRLSVSGDGLQVSIPSEAKDWLGFTSMVNTDSTTNVMLHVAPNTGEAARSATIAFTSRSGKNSSTVTATVSQMGLMGTLTNPFSVEQAIEYCQSLDGPTANDFYVKGIVSRVISGGEYGSYGNATFYISDDGEFFGEDDKNCDTGHDFEVYRALYFDNQKWNADVNKGNISVGDEVVVCGKLTLYKGIAETSQNAAYVYSINGVSSDENGLGSLAFPFNATGAAAAIDNGFQGNAFVKGIISEIANNGLFGAQYGNATFWISDDGIRHNDPLLDFEAYRALYLGNRKWQEGDDQISVGDEVILHGQLTKYGTTYETNANKAYIYSLNGRTE